MPIYTYRCENCGVQFEQRQSFSDAPLTVCPECHQSQLRKVITPAGIVFKGSGWYVTDHKSKSSASQPASTAKSESKDAAPVATPAADSGSSSTGSDTAAASKSDSSSSTTTKSE